MERKLIIPGFVVLRPLRRYRTPSGGNGPALRTLAASSDRIEPHRSVLVTWILETGAWAESRELRTGMLIPVRSFLFSRFETLEAPRQNPRRLDPGCQSVGRGTPRRVFGRVLHGRHRLERKTPT